MTTTTFLPYARQSINQADIDAVSQVLASDTITRGAKVAEFEEAFAKKCDAGYAVCFNSGSTALQAACHAIGLGPADKVITTPNSFIATAAPVIQRGATPVFVDIDPATGNLDLDHAEANLSASLSRGRHVVMPVHFAGIALDIDRLDRMICSPNTIIIEDAAHALGSFYKNGKKVGCCDKSLMTIFSFHPAKTITTGEGGMVTTNDLQVAEALKRYRDSGRVYDVKSFSGESTAFYYPGYSESVEMTGNFNITAFQAALGLSQLDRLDVFAEKRKELVTLYRDLLKDTPSIRTFTDAFDAHTVFHLFVVQIDYSSLGTTRKDVMDALKEQGIGSQVHYLPIYRHPCFSKVCGDIGRYFPKMENYFKEALSLPLYYDLSFDDVRRIVKALKHILSIG